EKSRSLISSCRRGGVVQKFLNHTTPSAPLKVASLLSLDVAATPPPAEEGSRLLQLSKRSGNLDSNAWPGGAMARSAKYVIALTGRKQSVTTWTALTSAFEGRSP